MVVIVSIVSAVAFVGVLPIVLGLVVFGGGGSGDPQQQLVEDAERRVQAAPNQVVPLVELAAAYRAAGRPQDEATALQKAIAAGPDDNNELQALVGGLSQQPAQQLQVLAAYTKAHPKDADAFFTYGAAAERAGQTLAARLAYQQAVKTSRPGSTLRENATTALERLRNAPPPTTPQQTIPQTPATPATP